MAGLREKRVREGIEENLRAWTYHYNTPEMAGHPRHNKTHNRYEDQ